MAALSSAMRRLASSMTPIALQTLGSHRYYRPLALAAEIINNHSLPPRLHFSSASDKSLLRVIDEEIESARDSEEHSLVDELPAGFPFEIEDNPGHRTVTLKRSYQDEEIRVVVHMFSLISNGQENQIDDDDDDEDSEKALQSSVPLVVSVSKKSGDSSLEFLCMAYVDEIVIESLTVKKTENTGDQASVYEGPDYSELDENLVKSFQKYLEIRGIKASTLSFLHEYMIDKDSKEYLAWLQKVKKFIAA